ncbi:MAG: hypothetical protein NC819_03505 [Candidatus Omnitrophica bacterium]|nr:hypothetical protein [Candidatus Omnitrophota bacterium]
MANPKIPAGSVSVPSSSALRLYLPETRGNSFSLDGFPSLEGGTDWLKRLTEIINTLGAVGMTTNQTLFRQLLETGSLDNRLRSLKAQGTSAAEIYRLLYNEEALRAAGAFRQIHARWPWDGRVSQEASALLTETEPLVREVRRIADCMKEVGSFTKIPNLPVGPEVTEKVLASGGLIHPNITLVFSDSHYLRTVEGYLKGLQARAREIDKIHSVNSLFVSRVDRVTDPMIDEAAQKTTDEKVLNRLRLIKGKTGVSQAKVIYRMFEAIFLGVPFQDPEKLYPDASAKIKDLRARFVELQGLGAHPQRLLIASTGVKSDQPYSPLLYVLPFLGPWTANTMPESTLEALSRSVAGWSDHFVEGILKRHIMREPLPAIPTDSKPSAFWDDAVLMSRQERREKEIGEITPDEVLRDLKKLVLEPKKTTLQAICDTLRDKGAASFMADEQATLQKIQEKLQQL